MTEIYQELKSSFRARFEALSRVWKSETAHLSSPTAIALHPAYQQIIGMGPAVLPLILQDLNKETNHWFWALRAITGVNPVPENDAGDIGKMVDAWIAWGRERGLVE